MYRVRAKSKWTVMVWIVVILGCVFIFCEYVVYFPVILQCSWPEMAEKRDPLRALFLSDPHLLGAIRGHWFDKLRREWQMERSFQTALFLLRPEMVFILGDVFDEGKWSSTKDWEDDVRRFKQIFYHSSNTELVVLIGNHDIGFHHEMTSYKLERFEKIFNMTSAKILTKRGVNFLLVNSVALHGDHCPICQSVEDKLYSFAQQLNCSTQSDATRNHCRDMQTHASTPPIILQHYPLYRTSDAECTGEDAAPLNERYQLFQERYDVLSQDASKKLLWWFQPRLILSGHTHSSCEVFHENRFLEISVPSFSWRNRNNPSFILVTMKLHTIYSLSTFRSTRTPAHSCSYPNSQSCGSRKSCRYGSSASVNVHIQGRKNMVRRADLGVSGNADLLGISHTLVSRVCSELCLKQ